MATNEKKNVDELSETYCKIEKSADNLKYLCNTYDLTSNELIGSEEICGSFEVKNVEVDARTRRKTFIMEYYDTLINDYTEFKCSFLDLSEKKIEVLFDEHGITVDRIYIRYLSSELQRIALEFNSYTFAIEQAGFNDTFTEFYTNNRITASNVSSIVQSDAFKNCLGPKGNKAKYDAMLKSLQDSAEMQLALALGFSAPTSAYVNGIVDCGNLVFGLVGKSSMGKSTASALISSVFSSPKYRATEGFARTAYSTALSLTEVMKHISGIPVLIDDLSANFKGNAENLIYSIEAGESKGHMNKDYTMAETGHWAGAFVINSERPILPNNCKEGARVRLLSFDNVKWTKDAEQSQLIKSVTSEHYGFYGERYVQNILKHGREYVAELVKDYSAKFKEKLGKCDGFTDRISFKIGIILASAELANEVLGGILTLSLEDIMSILVRIELDNYSKRNVYQTATEDIENWLKANVSFFNSSSNKIDNAYGIYENIVVNGKQEEYYYIIPDILSNFFDNRVYSKERNNIIEKWINNSIIIPGNDKDRNTVRKAVNGKITRCYKFNF